MAIAAEDFIKIRKQYLFDLNRIFDTSDPRVIQHRIKQYLREAEADEIQLTDPEAAHTYRRMLPEDQK